MDRPDYQPVHGYHEQGTLHRSRHHQVRRRQCGLLAGSLSWSFLTAIVPIVAGVVALTGIFLHDPTSQRAVESYLSRALAGVLSPADIQGLVHAATKHTGLLAIIAFVGFFWGSSNVGGSIANCCQIIFEVRNRPFLKEKLIDLGMLLLIAGTMLIVLAGSLATAFLSDLLGGHPLPGAIQVLMGVAVGYTASLALFSSVYLVFPNINFRFKWRFVWVGSVPAAAALVLVSFMWPLYVQISHFSKYSAFLFSILVLTAWIYFFSLILLMGAEIISVSAIRSAHRQEISVGPLPEQTGWQHLVLRRGHRPSSAQPTRSGEATESTESPATRNRQS